MRCALLEEAVALEDAIPYNEPPVWHHPVRQILGGVLLDAGRLQEAEAVYRADLVRVRENGWSLFGLMRSLEAQQRGADAAAVRARFERAWKRADLTLTSSRIITRRSPVQRRERTGRRSQLPTGVTLSYVEQGDPSGTPVILLHGITDSRRSFETMMPGLPRSLRVFAISQRGHGDSSKPAKRLQRSATSPPTWRRSWTRSSCRARSSSGTRWARATRCGSRPTTRSGRRRSC